MNPLPSDSHFFKRFVRGYILPCLFFPITVATASPAQHLVYPEIMEMPQEIGQTLLVDHDSEKILNKLAESNAPAMKTLMGAWYAIGAGGKRDWIKARIWFEKAATEGDTRAAYPLGLLYSAGLGTPIDYDNLLASGSMMGSGGMIVMDEDDCMVSVAKFYLEFTVEESCGKCTPCRIGNKRLLEILDRITKGKGTEEDLTELKNLAGVIRDSSLCALGQTAPNPVLSTMDNFWDEYVAHVRDKSCPAHQCRDLMSYVIDPKVCKGCSLCSRVCPTNAISGVLKQPYSIDQTVCIKCGTCMDKCKFGAISVR